MNAQFDYMWMCNRKDCIFFHLESLCRCELLLRGKIGFLSVKFIIRHCEGLWGKSLGSGNTCHQPCSKSYFINSSNVHGLPIFDLGCFIWVKNRIHCIQVYYSFLEVRLYIRVDVTIYRVSLWGKYIQSWCTSGKTIFSSLSRK